MAIVVQAGNTPKMMMDKRAGIVPQKANQGLTLGDVLNPFFFFDAVMLSP